MGSRKQIRSEQTKESKKTQYVARLNNVPTSPRKMRLIADLVRGMDADKALYVLQHTQTATFCYRKLERKKRRGEIRRKSIVYQRDSC